MFGLIKRYGAKKEAERVAEKEIMLKRKERAEDAVLKFRSKMLGSPCPLNKGEKCFSDCVHFEEGDVRYKMSLASGIPGFWNMFLPRCRLWDKR